MNAVIKLKKKLRTLGAIDYILITLGFVVFCFIFIPVVNFFFLDPIQATLNKFTDPQVRSAIYVSLSTATITTIIALVFCVPMGYILARHRFTGKSLVESVVDLPILIPHSVSGMIVLSAFGAQGIMRAFFHFPRDFFVGEIAGIIVAQLFVSAPFMVKLSREGFEAIDPKLEYVARTLGASRTRAFFTVTLPLGFRAIFTGSLLTWARAVSEFGAVLFIAYTPYTVPTLMLYRFNGWGISNARPIAILFLIICLWVFVVLRLLRRNPFRRVVQV